MRYPASEKLEIIRTVEASHLPDRQTLAMLGIPPTTCYRWYDRWSEGGLDALDDTAPHPGSVWNRLPDEIRADIVEFALEHEDLTPRELAVKYTDEKHYFVSESSVYRILKAEDLITAPAHIVMKAANEFKDKTTRPNELWQTDFTYLKVLGWGWFYLSTILDDYSRYIIAWKLCTTMKAEDVTATLDRALQASGCDSATVVAKPRLLSDTAQRQRLVLHRGRFGGLHRGKGHEACPRRALSSPDPGQDRALAPDHEEPRLARTLLPAWRPGTADRRLRRSLQQQALPREHRKPDARRCLLRARSADPETARGDQTKNHD